MAMPNVYLVETPKEIFWSKSKMDTQYKHVEFFWRDRAKYREMPEFKFEKYKGMTKKKVWEIINDTPPSNT
jgi:hypothetical protein